jgi:transposase
MLDFVPARLRVLRIRRPKYGCRVCATIHQAAAPERPIAKGMASPGLLAHVLVSKYCDHAALPPESDLRPARRRDRPLDLGELSWRCLLVVRAAAGATRCPCVRIRQICR